MYQITLKNKSKIKLIFLIIIKKSYNLRALKDINFIKFVNYYGGL